MKVKQIKERDCYIRGVNTVINAADPSTIPLLVSGTQRTTSVPALGIIPPPRFDSHSQGSNWHKLRFHDNDMYQSANVRQPKQGELQEEPAPIMANLHLSLNALDDICSQLELKQGSFGK